MTDWGAHMIDIANWAMGVKAPKAAVSVGGKFGFPDDAEETPDTQQALWEFDGFSMMWEHATAIGQGPYMRDHGVAFHGNNGVLVVDRGGWEVLPETETKNGKKTLSDDGRAAPRQRRAEHDTQRTCATSSTASTRASGRNSDVEIGHNSMIACHLANIAFRTSRRVPWDADRSRSSATPRRRSSVTKAYRAPWTLPAITAP